MSKTVYQTDPNGLYVGTAKADPCWRRPGVFIPPGGCVEEAPPEVGDKQVAKFVDGAWTVIPDWRGHIYWTADRVRHVITEAGVEPPADALASDPGPTAAQRWATLQGQAKAALDAASVTATRCVIAGVSFPDDWRAYVEALRAITRADSGDASAGLPTRPAYPAGT